MQQVSFADFTPGSVACKGVARPESSLQNRQPCEKRRLQTSMQLSPAGRGGSMHAPVQPQQFRTFFVWRRAAYFRQILRRTHVDIVIAFWGPFPTLLYCDNPSVQNSKDGPTAGFLRLTCKSLIRSIVTSARHTLLHLAGLATSC
jgi:hypothetical protein